MLGHPKAEKHMLPLTRFFQENKTEVFVIGADGNTFEMFESMRIYIERSGRSYNYLPKVRELNKKRDESNAEERQRVRKISESRQSNIKSPPSQSGHSGQQVSPRPMQQQVKVTPKKPAEPEITQQSLHLQESLPPGLKWGDTSEPVVVIIEKEDLSKSDAAAKKDEPKRKESIVQR